MTTNLPRIGVNVVAQGAGSYGAVSILQAGATATTQVQAQGSYTTALANIQVAAGGVLTANTPWLCRIHVKGKSGASPAAINLQMACETAAASTCYVKAGSEMRTR